MKRIATIAVLTAGLAQTAGAETLRDALAQAVAESPSIRSQRALVDALGEDQVQARSSFGPQVSVGANALSSSTNTDGVDTAVALSISQPVFASGRIANTARAAKADTQAGRQRLRAAEATLIADVARAYADVRRDEANLASLDELLKLLAAQAEEVTTRFDAGNLTRTDVEQMLMRQADARAARASAAAQLETSRAQYASVVGGRPATLAALPAVRTFPNVDAAISAAEAESPTIAAARFDQQGTRARVAAARSEYGPSVSLRGNVGYQQIWQYSQQQSIRADTLSVVVTQPLFTSGLNSSRVRQAEDRNVAAENLVQDARRKATRDVEQAWAAALAAHSRTTIGDERAQRARNAFEGVQIEFRAGLRTTLDVLNAAQELNSAESDAAGAERDAFVSDVSLLQAAGVLAQDSFSETPAPVRTSTIAPVTRSADAILASIGAPTPASAATSPTASATAKDEPAAPPVVVAQAQAPTAKPMASAPPPAPIAPAAVAPPPPPPPPTVETPARAPALTAAAPPAASPIVAAEPAPASTLAAASARYAIQIGAYGNADAANASLQRLADNASLAGKPQSVQTATVKGKLYYRALFSGFDDKAAATEACKALGAACFVRPAP